MEDRKSHFGPVAIKLCRTSNLLDLKRLVETDYGFPCPTQKWILGKSLVEKDDVLLESALRKYGSRNVYLYIVPVANDQKKTEERKAPPEPPKDNARKGRYWNYETSRWSFCSSDGSDTDEKVDAKKKDQVGVVVSKKSYFFRRVNSVPFILIGK